MTAMPDLYSKDWVKTHADVRYVGQDLDVTGGIEELDPKAVNSYIIDFINTTESISNTDVIPFQDFKG